MALDIQEAKIKKPDHLIKHLGQRVTEENPNLLLIHGWGFNSYVWHKNIEYLDTHYNIYTLDLNGHGNNIYNKKYENIDLYLSQILSELATAPIEGSANNKLNILGWSLGGIIALLLKLKSPNLIKNIILCCSNPCFLSKNDWSYGVDNDIWNQFTNNLLDNPEKTIKEFLLLQTMGHKDAKQLYKQLLEFHNNSSSVSIEGLNWGLDILQKDFREYLNDIDNKQVSFFLGQKDRLVNKNLIDWLYGNHPDIKIFQFKKSGHMPFITEPDLFYKYIKETLNNK